MRRPIHRGKLPDGLLPGAGLAVLAAVMLGCAGPVPVRSGSPVEGGGQAGAWEAVFLPAGTSASLAGAPPVTRAEYARRDEGLAVEPRVPLLATNQWPQRARPSIERTRRVFLPREARTALFFVPRREPWWWDRWGGWREGDRRGGRRWE